MESNSVLLKFIYAKKFMKYDNRVLKSEKGQFFIVYEEMLILKRKLLKLIGFFYLKADTWQNLYNDISERLKKKFNKMLKELNHILNEVGNCALQEFANEPEKIGVESVKYFFQLHKMQKYKDENEEFLELILLLKEMVEFYKSSVDIYFILNRSYERNPMPLTRAQTIVYQIMKATSFWIELKNDVFKHT